MSQNDLSSLKLSQQSNGLAFSPHHLFSSSYHVSPPLRSAKKLHSSARTPRKIDPAEGRGTFALEKSGDILELQKFTSLIPPVFEPQSVKERRTVNLSEPLPSSAASIRSFSSSVGSKKRKISPVPTLEALPFEIRAQIVAYLPQESLYDLTLTSTAFVQAATIALYRWPRFTSTFRFAQFVTTVIHCRSRAEMVRALDLASFGILDHHNIPIAGWREWKYRMEPLYSLQHKEEAKASSPSLDIQSERRHVQAKWNCVNLHPPPNPLLKQYSTCRDVPLGAIVHILTACTRLRYIDISGLSLSTDYAIKTPSYPPSAFTSLIFVSDVPKSWTWKGADIKQVQSCDVIRCITLLSKLENLRIKKSCWLSSQDVDILVNHCPPLQYVDFSGSGMKQNLSWARKGRKADIAHTVRMLTKKDIVNQQGTPSPI